jgi:hypothetical protein
MDDSNTPEPWWKQGHFWGEEHQEEPDEEFTQYSAQRVAVLAQHGWRFES